VKAAIACAAAIFLALIGRCVAANGQSPSPSRERSGLAALAAQKFPNLTRCERAVLEFADLKTTTHGDPPACGPSSQFDDPSNDPKNAAQWDHQRDLRAELIRWLFVDPDATRQIDPGGVAALGARVVGNLDLSNVHAPFGLTLGRCAIPEFIAVGGADIGSLTLSGSHTGEIIAGGSHVRGGVFLDQGFEASAPVFFGNSRIGSDFNAAGGSFKHSKTQGDAPWDAEKPALFLGAARVQGPIWLSAGFTADGAVDVNGVTCDGLFCYGGKFINPGNIALTASAANVSGIVALGSAGKWHAIEANGLVQFNSARIGALFYADGATFTGKSTELHGLQAGTMSVGAAFVWRQIHLENGAVLDLGSATVNGLVDDEQSWPQPGRLGIDGFVYGDFYGGPTDARSRLRWIALASGWPPPGYEAGGVSSGFQPQPYRELAKVLRNRGDDAGARQVLIAEEDARYSGESLPVRLWAKSLNATIGYGYAPLRALAWSLAVVLAGWAAVWMGKRAGVMRPTYPENSPPSAADPYEELHPLLYSLDVFLPFVNLHQEHYWWPDAAASGKCVVLGRVIRLRGRTLRHYLWLQIVAGWLLSAIFVAGVTGLLRND
jgi:hypothetical protein